MNDMENLTFIFKKRKMNVESNIAHFAKEHFYYFFEFKKKYTTNFIEEEKPNIVLFLCLKMFRKIFKRPLYLENYTKIKSIGKLINSRYVITTNQNILYSIYPLLFLIKFFKKKIKIYTFVMGLNENLKLSNKKLAKIFFKSIDYLFFISKNEKNYYENIYPEFAKKFKYIPFSIDLDFWKYKKNETVRDKILFLGSDSKRDYIFLEQLIKHMPEKEFIVVSSNDNLNFTDYLNVEYYNSNYENQILTDLELKNLMNSAFISIIPIVDSLQPSGQSVALQSMAMEIPVMITKTNGFWDPDNLINNKNVVLLKENSLELWKNEIEKLENNSKHRDHLIENSRLTLEKYFNIESNFKLLSQYF